MPLRLDRLDSQQPIVDASGKPLQAYHRRDTKLLEQLEDAFTELDTQLAAITALQTAQTAQLALITDAQTRLAIGLSWTVPSLILTASDAGASATITVAAHLRVYANGQQNSLPAGSFTGLAYSTPYAIYYDPDGLGDSSPTYVITTNLIEAQHNYAPMRVYVGTIQTPAAAAPPVTSGNVPPGSYGGTGSYNEGALL
jgi:hypothetical protein